MAKRRMIDTRFWSDNFISELNPLDRYLFLYFLTNEHTNISGIYEVPLKRISDETGIEKDMLLKMMKRLKGKIEYIDGWVAIKNFAKYQSDNESVRKGVENGLAQVPPRLLAKFQESWQEILTPTTSTPYKQLLHSTRKRILKRDKDTCQKCGVSDRTGETLDIDHITPRVLGGTSDDENLRVLCKSCNQARNGVEYDILGRSIHTGTGSIHTATASDISELELESELKPNTAQSAGAALIGELIKAFEEVDPKNKTYYGNTNQRKAADFLIKEYGLEEVLKRVAVLPRTNKAPYFPTITTPVQLRDKWVQLGDAVERRRGEIKSKVQPIV